jgi:hypothetical protein
MVPMFDTVLGLPVHVLVVHAVVVGLPLMAVVTAAVALMPGLRQRFAWPVVMLDAGVVAATFVARESGEVLQRRLGGSVAQEHAALGRNLVWFAVLVLVAAVAVALTRQPRRPTRASAAAALTVVAGALAIWWTVRVGHTGAEAVWQGIVQSTTPDPQR